MKRLLLKIYNFIFRKKEYRAIYICNSHPSLCHKRYFTSDGIEVGE